MGLTPYEIAELMAKYLKNELSSEEASLLQEHLDERQDDQFLLESFQNTPEVQKEIDFISGLDIDHAWKKTNLKKNSSLRKPIMKWLIAAAAIVICALVVLWPKSTKQDSGIIADVTGKYKNDVLPGSNKAELLLSDGTVVALDDEVNQLKEQNGISIIGGAGEVKYISSTSNNNYKLYNTLRVPKAGTYRLILPDGSKVWLNALSEINFPVQFTGNERKVSLKGEAYFEVNKDAKRAFKVEVNGSTVEVLGTHFNVNAYESTNATTLLEGQVKVSYQQHHAILKPGQVANVLSDDIQVKPADMQKATAWKDEVFLFKEDKMDFILNELSRWYDLRISYRGKQPMEIFSGSITRNAKLSEVLEMLNFISGASFEIEDRNLHVTY